MVGHGTEQGILGGLRADGPERAPRPRRDDDDDFGRLGEAGGSVTPSSAPRIRTPDQRLRVFVSSTLRDLAEERHAAQRAIETLRLTPVMFELGARPYPPRSLYRAYLEQSHVFLGVYWQSYGWV